MRVLLYRGSSMKGLERGMKVACNFPDGREK